ncbi:hypothetical protein CO112_02365 [Candidatus Dojkabacteria bacterium CG_4_9_14_3_um_filter_150_Dojkabacteria_WS6_41_13]|uniref:Uncharacterized protein n=1 Tax=Candidatus Dojkabacteria bacterium CG_4_10_14_0_2_um_filter_Dojkabacteria_WS6_41_15 TaxID=2014249 RepID=A0A2M7W1T6_9BACT|nr:MAG: hypothetical protein COZ14_02065 [Candidatus Dojkabacteria bacterium CG_4_10_14_3_um_filter_Dojkabacteria_WS6_41_9]PJA13837.1 MAG: hypothetical protein COX64_02765 [Candidatus Dojkabacteria bacterium CG_4_10_14_0_2_um_filter_Dojkabacteria_WS6_41_15]PJB22819.1 MAG: hypothetical protein CO112_02365 [Candidatus Dojkabacteria bacterium CG_4_9_14_3_um_filter_150_Dojkabacteria_WS6_41_13]
MQSGIKTIKAMTLVEVLVALAIVSFVFSSLLQMTFDALKRAKILELQDKMRNYATEAAQVVYSAKDLDWETNFSDTSSILPPAQSTSQPEFAYIDYVANKPVLKKLTGCSYDPATHVIGGNCIMTAANEQNIATNKIMFGRIIKRTDDATKTATNTLNDASIEIIVACIENKCSPKDFLPFQLSFTIYRTSAPQ